MDQAKRTYDVAIIGSGIGGSTLAAILARQGLNVVLFEAGSHPKFAVGESMILETSETMRAMAEFFDVPELAYFSSENYFNHIGTSHGVKRHFSYLHHVNGQPHNDAHALQAVIPKQPHGHELHLYRQDSDYFLTATAISYGATILQNTPVADIELREDGVTVVTKTGTRYEAKYVVDAGGYKSLLADKFGWRDRDLQAHSRTIFTHMVNVPCFNSVGKSHDDYGIPFRLSEGTLHHIFHGGWLWVIPFNNHARATNPMISIGLQLDPRIYPTCEDLTPEAEFYDIINRFPGIAPQFRDAKVTRAWTRTERLQYTSKQVVGDRFCLLGHAAGFIDPLYSKGLYTTLMSVAQLANLLLAAQTTQDYSAAAFQTLEQLTQAYVRSNDRLVANSFKSWSNYKLWSVFSVLWLLGAYLEYVYLLSARGQAKDRHDYFERVRGLKLVGGGFPEFETLSNQVHAIMERTDPSDDRAVVHAEAEIRALYAAAPWMPWAYQQVLAGKNHLPAQKFRLGLLDPEKGFMGSGVYRQHFFGSRSLPELGWFVLCDTLKYATPLLNRRKQNAFVRQQRERFS
jgi:FADH2 O2-dependent halogenase